jgi:hypothetical protein
MSDLIKLHDTPQFNWYTCWTSLGANVTPENLIKEGLKQSNYIKISFEKGAKEITGHIAPDQAQFGAEYFLTYTLLNFKSKILTQLSNTQKDNGPLLFNLMGLCFQDIGLTKWTNVSVKQCPDNADCTKANFLTNADPLALYCQEARSHTHAQVHAASSTACQLS